MATESDGSCKGFAFIEFEEEVCIEIPFFF